VRGPEFSSQYHKKKFFFLSRKKDSLKTTYFVGGYRYMSVIPALWRLKQEDQMFEVRDPVSKNKFKNYISYDIYIRFKTGKLTNKDRNTYRD
jgi:hypothetical protein